MTDFIERSFARGRPGKMKETENASSHSRVNKQPGLRNIVCATCWNRKIGGFRGRAPAHRGTVMPKAGSQFAGTRHHRDCII